MYKRNSLFVLCLIGLFSFSGKAQCGANYDEHLEKIVSSANQLPHSQTRIVFAGSSTFRLWDNIAESFPEYEVVNAGIGGSCFDDLYRYKEQLISDTKPDILVIYEGDNDIVHVEEDGSQREVFTIHSDAWKLMNWIRNTHPNLPVFILSPKPSPSRWEHLARYKAVNSLLQQGAEAYNYHFMDCWPWLTDNNGEVDSKLFISDMLHLNAKGNGRLGPSERKSPWSRTCCKTRKTPTL